MTTAILRIASIVLLVLSMQRSCLGAPPSFCITSPDRPPVWFNLSGDKLSQYLEWSHTKHQLVLHVAYANVANTPAVWSEQSFIDTFHLSFPTVRLDKNKTLYAKAQHNELITVGHIEPSIFGDRVILSKGLEVSAHRRNGVVNGSIIFSHR
jgi:hypothetical protein